MRKGVIVLSVLGVLLSAAGAAAQDEFITYTLDGKEVRLTDVKLEWNADNYITIEGVAKEKVDLGENAVPRFREAEAGLTFQIAPQGDSFVATYKTNSSDTLPIYVSWYEVGKKDGFTEIFAHQADLDSSVEGQTFMVTIENFGNEGTLIKGTFSGKLNGDDGMLHAVDGGRFAVRRRNVKDR
jgi:hypothetical protein